MINRFKTLVLLAIGFILFSCENFENDSGKLNVVATTSIFSDLVERIGGDKISLQGLMGPGVDPHLYKASEGDVSKLGRSDIIFYGGLHLEGRMADILERMHTQNKVTVPLGDSLNKSDLISSENFGGNYDPHIWFNVSYFKECAQTVANVLGSEDPENAEFYQNNNEVFQKELDELELELREKIEELAQEKRILVTAHDAFSYFGKEYGFTVIGLQGISTATEAGVRDVQRLRDYIVENKVKAIFIESSVPRRNIEALQKAVESQGHQVEIGGTLFSDALGPKDSDEGSYIGMFRYNVNTIVNSLK